MSFIYHTFFFDPLYNVLILLFQVFPWIDAGIAVIILTIIVRLILFPLSRKAVLTQIKMNEIAPVIEKIKEQYKDKPEAQARETLALYREKQVNPFSGIFVILIQLPLIFALYRIFLHFSEMNTSLLYSFVTAPEKINMMFLGLLNLAGPSILLALGAALSSFFQLRLSAANAPKPSDKGTFGDNLAKSMQSQMKYLFPIMVFFISYKVSAVIALYWLTTNLFSIGQEVFIRRRVALA